MSSYYEDSRRKEEAGWRWKVGRRKKERKTKEIRLTP
jgi:hypothetical protein